MEERFQTGSSAVPIRPSRFAFDVEQLLGEDLDLDPLFLEESWTVGKSVALENLLRRRQRRVEFESQNRAASELDNLDVLLADRAATIAGSRDVIEVWRATQATATYCSGDSSDSSGDSSEDWTPHDWVPLDRTKQSWIPAGWMPEGLKPKEEPLPQPQRPAEPSEECMTISRARQILEITSASTREQVRSAYRRRVTQCHPDRLQGATEATRRHATQEMAAINEAYRLLCSAMLQTA